MGSSFLETENIFLLKVNINIYQIFKIFKYFSDGNNFVEMRPISETSQVKNIGIMTLKICCEKDVFSSAELCCVLCVMHRKRR